MTPASPPRRGALALLALLLTWACGTEPELQAVQPEMPDSAVLVVAGRDVTVELSYDDAARNQGLKHRTSLADDRGMLFLFVDDAPRLFWMRDTLIPLDIAFLDADGTVINIEAAPPGVERPGFHSRRPARFVLELNEGWSERFGLAPGDRIEISESLRALAQP